MRAIILVSALSAVGACSGGSTRPAPVTPVTTQAGKRETGFAAGTTRYRAISHAHQEQLMEGNRQELNFVAEYLTTVTLTPAGDHFDAVFTIDSLRSEGGMLSPQDLARARGSRLTAFLAKNGEISQLTGDSLLTGQLQAIATAVRQFFPRLPVSGAEPGKQWTDTTTSSTSGSPSISIQSVNERRVGEWSTHGNERTLPIQVHARYSLTGSGQQMGQDFTLSGSGERNTTQYLGAGGRYLGATSRDSSNVTISLTAMGIAFPSIQIRSDTVSVIP